MKRAVILDKETGEIMLEKEFTGGYHLIYADAEGFLNHDRNLENARFGNNHQIKNFIYRPIAEKLVKKFKEIKHIPVKSILFIEEMFWTKPVTDKPKKHWMARISKANKQLTEMTGYLYILETRNFFIEEMSREQIIGLIYHELRHIDQYGNLQSHDIEDWSNMLATLGTDWACTQSTIINLIEDKINWKELEPLAKQLNIYNFEDYSKEKKAL